MPFNVAYVALGWPRFCFLFDSELQLTWTEELLLFRGGKQIMSPLLGAKGRGNFFEENSSESTQLSPIEIISPVIQLYLRHNVY